jgi:hypothetical protein
MDPMTWPERAHAAAGHLRRLRAPVFAVLFAALVASVLLHLDGGWWDLAMRVSLFFVVTLPAADTLVGVVRNFRAGYQGER